MEYIVTFVISIIGIYRCQLERKGFAWYLFFIQPIIVLAALRTIDIGYDTHVYVFPEFNEAAHSNNIVKYLQRYFASGYLLINYGVSRVTNNVHVYLYVMHSIMYIPILYSLYRYRKVLYVWVGVFILCFVFYNESLNTSRQFAALSMDVMAFSYFLNKKWIKVISFIFLGYEFHHSALLFALVIVLCYMILSKHRYFKKLSSKVIIISGIIILLLSFSVVVEAFLNYAIIDERYGIYKDSQSFKTNIPISKLTFCSINLLCFYFSSKEIRNKLWTLAEYMYIVAFLLCFSALISTYTVRIMEYFNYLSVFLIPLMYGKKNSSLSILHLSFFVVYWIFVVVVANLGDTYPYKSVLFD